MKSILIQLIGPGGWISSGDDRELQDTVGQVDDAPRVAHRIIVNNGNRAAAGQGFGIEQDPAIWSGKPKISHARAVEWALDNMVFANIPPEDSPSSAAFGFYLIARRSPADAAKFLKDNLPKTLREEAKRGAGFVLDAEKLNKHIDMVEKMGSDAVHYERELLNRQAKADGR